jgi:hypothetical protein
VFVWSTSTFVMGEKVSEFSKRPAGIITSSLLELNLIDQSIERYALINIYDLNDLSLHEPSGLGLLSDLPC